MASTQQATTIESPENFLVSELILKPPRQPDWIFPDLWQAMTPGLFTGDGGLGKTHFALQMALAIATGGKIDGTPTGCASPRSVVYISQEDEAEHLYAALLSQWPDLKDNHDVTDRIRIISTAVQGHPLFLSELNHQRDLIQNISQGAVFFLDSFSNFITSNENDNSQILKSEIAGLRRIMRICKATPMLILTARNKMLPLVRRAHFVAQWPSNKVVGSTLCSKKNWIMLTCLFRRFHAG